MKRATQNRRKYKMDITVGFSFAVTIPNANDVQGTMQIKSVRDIYDVGEDESDGKGTYDAIIKFGSKWSISHQMKMDDDVVMLAAAGDSGSRQSLVEKLVHASRMPTLKGTKVMR